MPPRIARRVEVWWEAHASTVLRVAIGVMVVLAALKLGDELLRLVWRSGYPAAIDLKLRHTEVHRWFAGLPVYGKLSSAIYPPASYSILWLPLGWLEFGAARWLWAATSACMLAWLVVLLVRESGARTRLERLFVALLPLSMNQTGVTIGNGQLISHILPMQLASILILYRSPAVWPTYALASVLLLLAQVKPTVSVPFLLLAAFTPRAGPVLFAITFLYAGLTILAASFQEASLVELFREWLAAGKAEITHGGYADLHSWLSAAGLESWMLPGSVVALVALGAWLWRYRTIDLWHRLGVTALVARFWTYHRGYDDMLLLLPMVTLFRIVKRDAHRGGTAVAAGGLLGLLILAMLLPARLKLSPHPVDWLFTGGHSVLRLLTFGFLLVDGSAERNKDRSTCRSRGSSFDV